MHQSQAVKSAPMQVAVFQIRCAPLAPKDALPIGMSVAARQLEVPLPSVRPLPASS